MSTENTPDHKPVVDMWRVADIAVAGAIVFCNVIGYIAGIGSLTGLILIVGSLGAGTGYWFWRNHGFSGLFLFLALGPAASTSVMFVQAGAFWLSAGSALVCAMLLVLAVVLWRKERKLPPRND